jgi:hypothetical protein
MLTHVSEDSEEEEMDQSGNLDESARQEIASGSRGEKQVERL